MRPTDDEILTLYINNTAPQIAVILGRPYNTVRKWIQEARTGRRGHELRDRQPRTSRTRMSAEDIASVMVMRSEGLQWTAVAKCFSRSPDTLRWAVRNAEERGMAAYPPSDRRY